MSYVFCAKCGCSLQGCQCKRDTAVVTELHVVNHMKEEIAKLSYRVHELEDALRQVVDAAREALKGGAK